MIDWTNDKIAELIALARAAAVLVAIATVGYAYAKTRSLTTLLLAAINAGIFLWSVNNTSWWQQKVEEEASPNTLDLVAAVPAAAEDWWRG